MQRVMCKAKIHRATVTDADLSYQGSLTLDPLLMEAADIREYEQVQVANLSNGVRFETYAIAGERGSGQVVVNGAAARLAQPGDLVIVMCFGLFAEEELASFRPRFVFVDGRNRIAPPPGTEDAAPGIRVRRA